MGLHLYCILPAGLEPPSGTVGIAGTAVAAVSCGRISCWTSTHEQRPAADTPAVRAHNAVVTAGISPEVTPVPLRFGQWAADPDAVRQSVAADAAHWLDLLRRFAGHAEYGVRVARTEALQAARDVHPREALTGKEYMAALAHGQAASAGWRAEAERVAAEVLGRAGDLVSDSRTEPPRSASDMLSLAHLVAWRQADAYHGVMTRIRSDYRDLRFLFTGPWPPYSFVA